jgi:methionyl-tRNA synthetase
MAEKFYITTAISYPNGEPHIGHAYELITTDAIARFKRLDGFDVFFLTGTDEHGLKMQQQAEREGLIPRQVADKNSARFLEMAKLVCASNDDFIRTTEERHYKASTEIWKRMEKNGDIYLGHYAGWYSVRDEAFYAEAETAVNEKGERVGPNGSPVTWTEEESYFFRLSKYQEKLLALYEEQPDFISPGFKRNEVVSFVKSGLQDLSISRTTFNWGVPVPGNERHVMYVWVDALTNYLSATGWPEDGPRAKYWPADVHIIGKDIVRFHAVYWPAFLLSAGLPLPKRIFAHGFLTVKGEKMSKSVGNVVDPFALVKEFGVDAVRYFCLREMSYGQDGSYDADTIVRRLNSELANDLGNLAQRSLSMIAKNCDGILPGPAELIDLDNDLLTKSATLHGKLRARIKDYALHDMLGDIWAIIADANRYFAFAEPWKKRKEDPECFGTIMWVTAETLRRIGILVQPFIPEAASKLLDQLAVPPNERAFAHLGEKHALKGGTKLPPPIALFPRYEPAEKPVAK